MTEAAATVTPVVFQTSRTVPAERSRVFRAWTEPEELKRWWRADPSVTTPFAEVDLRLGGSYRLAMQAPTGATHIVGGVFREIDEPSRLVYTWRWEGEDDRDGVDSVVTVEFLERGSETEVVVTHEGFVTEESRDLHGQGWTGCLEALVGLWS